jgi:Ca2+-binding EF-hand superfamily protein
MSTNSGEDRGFSNLGENGISSSPTRDGSKSLAAPCAGRFGALDINNDGGIAQDEFKGSKKVFAWIDADHDGFVSRPEATRAALDVIGRLSLAEQARAYRAMDTNKDGKIAQDEFKGPKHLFARIDANHDGSITRAEAVRAFRVYVHRAMIVAGLKAMDRDKDGTISAAEYTGPKPGFARLDVNEDGRIGPRELARVFWMPMTRHQVAATGPATTSLPRPVKPVSAATAPAAARQAANRPVALIRNLMALDTDKDGKVLKAEFLKACEARYNRMDSNHDGPLTSDEVQALLAKHQ